MKKHIQILLLISIIFFTGCQKEEINTVEQSSKESTSLEEVSKLRSNIYKKTLEVVHNYEYKGQKFRILYVLDSKGNKILKVGGDVTKARKIFGKANAPQVLFFETSKEKAQKKVVINVKMFQTKREADYYVRKLAGESKERIMEKKLPFNCNDAKYPGQGNFYFFHHAFYNSEMTGLRKTKVHYSRDWNLGGYDNKLSSFFITKPSNFVSLVRLYQYKCFNGKVIYFFTPKNTSLGFVGNLNYYILSWWWWWPKKWNDQTSSYKVSCWHHDIY